MKTTPLKKTTRSWWKWPVGIVLGLTVAMALFLELGPRTSVPPHVAWKIRSSWDAREIIKSYLYYAGSFGEGAATRIFPLEATSDTQVVTDLAQMGEFFVRTVGLTDGSLWYVPRDPALKKKTIPDKVLSDDPEPKNNLASVRPISWAVAVNVPRARMGDENFPLLWTRGLRENGTWAKGSPWKGKGGHIAFADGHVRWTDSIADLDLTDKNGTAITTLSQLLGDSGAVVLEDKPAKN